MIGEWHFLFKRYFKTKLIKTVQNQYDGKVNKRVVIVAHYQLHIYQNYVQIVECIEIGNILEFISRQIYILMFILRFLKKIPSLH